MKEQKFLYETTVQKQVEENVTEKRQENGQEVSVTKKAKVLKPVKLALLKPSRRMFEQAEIFYAKTIAEFIKAGLLPYSLVAKRYANDGGPLSEPEIKRLEVLKKEALELEKRFYDLSGAADEKSATEKKEILVKLNNINLEVGTIQNTYADIFDNTAEMKARNKVIEWWALHISLMDEDNKGYKPVFSEGSYDDKLDKYDELEEASDAFVMDVIKRLAYLTSFWFSAKTKLEKGDYEGMEKIYDETVSTYDPQEGLEPKPEDKPAEKPADAPAPTAST